MNGLFLAFKGPQWARLCSRTLYHFDEKKYASPRKMFEAESSWYSRGSDISYSKIGRNCNSSVVKKGFHYKKEEIYFPPGTSEFEISMWANLAKEQAGSSNECCQIDEIVKKRLKEMDSADALGKEMKETAEKISLSLLGVKND